MKLELVHLADENSSWLSRQERKTETETEKQRQAAICWEQDRRLFNVSSYKLPPYCSRHILLLPTLTGSLSLSLTLWQMLHHACYLRWLLIYFSFILVLVSSIKHFSLERTDLSYWVQKMSLIPGSASGGSKREL